MTSKNEDRIVAIAEGRLHYTGSACRKCKSTLRYVKGNSCISCIKARKDPEASRKYAQSAKGKAVRQDMDERHKQSGNRANTLLRFRCKRHGITVDQYYGMLVNQNYCCAICETSLEEKNHIDHCHQTNVVRGLLCIHCNIGLGAFKDNKKSLQKALRYLE